ncbi:hypothetical protein IMZ48_47100 [Candidatus Bathyarchaeota archaeon]|nr:hypothetical protein [Candidatus Bathyarchaeota archaeon]
MATEATTTDFQVAALAAGFTIGFGFLTVWEAIKQTKRIRNPFRNVYTYLVWGEILANLGLAVIGWLLVDGVLETT